MHLFSSLDYPLQARGGAALPGLAARAAAGCHQAYGFVLLCMGSPSPAVFQHLSLRHLELTLEMPRARLEGFFINLSHFRALESFTMIRGRHLARSSLYSQPLSEVCLHTVTTLTHVKLVGWFPTQGLSLPPESLLSLWQKPHACSVGPTLAERQAAYISAFPLCPPFHRLASRA